MVGNVEDIFASRKIVPAVAAAFAGLPKSVLQHAVDLVILFKLLNRRYKISELYIPDQAFSGTF